MATSINLGNIINVNGKTVSTGGASGIDVESIVNGLVKIREDKATKVSDEVKLNSSKVSALSSYRTMLSSFKTVTDFLKNPPGVGTASANTFEYRRVFATSSDGSAASNYVSVSASAGATLGSYAVEVDNLAVAKSNVSRAYTSRTADLVTVAGAGGTPKAGTFTLGGQSITLAIGDTLEDIVSKINSTTPLSKVKADIIKVGDTDYRLKITAVETGVVNAYAVAGDATVFDSMFVGGVSIATAADNAQLSIDGIAVTRPTNTIGDAIDGVSFTLYQETGLASVNVGILSDPSAVTSKIQEFVDAYNNIKVFIAKQQQRDGDDKLVETAILGESDPLNNFADSAIAELSAAVSGLDADIRGFGDIGLSFTDYAGDADNPEVRNVLQIDTAKLQTVLDSNFDDVRKVFEFQMTSNAPDKLAIFSRTNAMDITEFQLDIDLTRADEDDFVRVIYTDANGDPQTINADYTFSDQTTVLTTDISDGIFGVTSASSTFLGLSDGDSFRIALTEPDGTITNHDFVFKATPGAANEFSDFNELQAAIDAVSGITATIDSAGHLAIVTDAQFDTMTFTNLGAADFKGELALEDTSMPSGTLSGQAGTVLEGLKMVYVPSDGTDIIDVSFTQGIADRISNVLSDYLTEETGFIAIEVDSIQEDNKALNQDLTDINDDIADYRDKLYGQFSGLEAAITRINSLLLFLDAQDKARNNNS